MSGTPFFTLREGRTAAGVWTGLVLTAVLANGLAAIWLFAATPMLFRVWGFTLLPVGLAPLPFVLWAFRADWRDLAKLRELFAPARRWPYAIVVALLAVAAPVAVDRLAGSPFRDPSWAWDTYALSTVLDLPLLFVWTAPMLVLGELAWRRSVALAPARSGGAARALASALLWTASLAVPLAVATRGERPEFVAGTFGIVFFSGLFAYRMQRGGAVVLSALPVLVLALGWCLCFGMNIPEIDVILFGYDVEKVTALISEHSRFFPLYPYSTAFVLLIGTLLSGRKLQDI